jgi:hypothetical protein
MFTLLPLSVQALLASWLDARAPAVMCTSQLTLLLLLLLPGRLRADMEAQAAALRNVVEHQGGEVAALRAAAAAAEAQSTAAKVELAQVRGVCGALLNSGVSAFGTGLCTEYLA